MNPALRLTGIRKRFGSTTAVESLDLEVPSGALYGVIGPNGAGKTTTIRMIMSILFPDAGELSVLGHASALEAKDRIGYLPEERGVYRRMPVGAFLTLTSTAPPPAWQVWLTILIGIGSVTAAIWFAAKVFRIGLLMYGKPPDLATLIRWARSA